MDIVNRNSDAYLFLGLPGSGKSTQADLFARRLDATHLNMGSLLRTAALDSFSHDASLFRSVNESGSLVDDDTVRRVLDDGLRNTDPTAPVIIDGAPRRESQVEVVHSVIWESGRDLRKVVFLEVPEEMSVARILTRFACASCGQTLILGEDLSSETGSCPFCGGYVTRRLDDSEAGIRKRIRVFRDETVPVIERLEREGALVRISGVGSPEEVFSAIRSAAFSDFDS
jgi:adenylate kinase